MILYKKITDTDWYLVSKIPFSFIMEQAFMIRNYLLIFIAISIVLSLFISYFIFTSISQPLKNLVREMNTVEKGELSIKIFDNSKDEIGIVFSKFLNMVEKIKNLIHEISLSKDRIRNLLDNTNHGYLTFGKSLIVDKEYSKECNNIFNHDITGENIIDIAFKDIEIFSYNVFNDIFKENKKNKTRVLLNLLPENIKIDNRFINIKYNIIKDIDNEKRVLLILSDITEKTKLEQTVENERKTLKMIVKSVTSDSDYIDSINDFKYFSIIMLNDILNSEIEIKEKISTILRHMHTFKGNFSQLEMENTAIKIHNFETTLSNILSSKNNLKINEIKKYIKSQKLDKWPDDDINLIKKYLGNDFYSSSRRITTTIDTIKEIENKILMFLSQEEYNKYLPELSILKQRSFKHMINKYIDYVLNLAKSQEKLIHLFEIKGDDFSVDPERYCNFINSLVHVFRNIVAHGIEHPDERERKGKNIYGQINCEISNDDNIVITISDDGNGINIEKLKDKIKSKHLLTDVEIESLENTELLDYIFYDNLSTSKSANIISGRGVGLAAVKEETKALDGNIKVISEKDLGTKLIFIIPHEKKYINYNNLLSKLFDSVFYVISQYIKPIYSKITITKSNMKIIKGNSIILKEYTSYISFRAVLNGKIIFSMDEETITFFETISIFSKNTSKSDILLEISNIISGKALSRINSNNKYLKLGSPILISSKSEIKLKYPQNEIPMIEIYINNRILNIFYVPHEFSL